MDKIKRRLEKLTGDVLLCADPTSEQGMRLAEELKLLQELSRTHKMFDGVTISDERVRQRLDVLTDAILRRSASDDMFSVDSYMGELDVLQQLVKTWSASGGIEVRDEQAERDRRSNKTWDAEQSNLTTDVKLTKKQQEAMALLDSGQFDKFLALGGSGSGKSWVLAYKLIRDSLRHRAPCLIARDKLVDLRQGMIDQVIPSVLGAIAKANGQDRWEQWTIDGLKFAKWTDKKTQLEFATGGYIRLAGLSARDLTESGSDKILSPSWLHVMGEEISELDYEIIEKLVTRLRYVVNVVPPLAALRGKLSDFEREKFKRSIADLQLKYEVHERVVIRDDKETLIATVQNVMALCENPPSVNHWSYKRYFEHKREDGSKLSDDEIQTMYALLMNPQDNVENLGESYIRNLSQMTGANYERFYLGQFQDTETGEVLKSMQWTDNLPRRGDWDGLCIYTDPTPLTGKDYSKWADFKASVLVGLFDGNTYVLDVRIVRGSTEQMLMQIKQLWDESPNKDITQVVMEKKAVPSDFNQVWRSFGAKSGWMVPIRMDTRQFGEKKATIETFLQPLHEDNRIFYNSAFRDTERGRETQVQILKFSRKSNKAIHDDIPDAIMRADTYLKGRSSRIRKRMEQKTFASVLPGFIHR